jgi:hypothetical protein
LRKIAKATTNYRFESACRNANASNSIRNGHRIVDRSLGRVKVRVRRKKRSWAKIDTKFEVLEGKITIDLPIRTISEANCFEPWQVKHGRHKDQQKVVTMALNPLKENIRLPCKIMLTRFAPDELDAFDNLPMSFKYIVDAICAVITGNYVAGRADGDKRIKIACDQVKSNAYGIRIEISD